MNAGNHHRFEGIELVRLGRDDWRVNDAANPDQPLGYIERQRPGRFEVMWMTDPVRWSYAVSLSDAVTAFGDSARFGGEILDQRAEVVPGRRPRITTPNRRATWIRPSGTSGAA